VLGGQCDQFVDQFLVLTLQIDLVDNLADAADRPQFLDEGLRVVRGLLDQLGGKTECLLRAIDLARQRDLGIARLLVTSHQHQLIACKQVDRVLGIHAADGRALFSRRVLQIKGDL